MMTEEVFIYKWTENLTDSQKKQFMEDLDRVIEEIKTDLYLEISEYE